MAQLSVALLGPPEIRHEKRIITFPTRKSLAILVYLLLEGAPQPREKLTALFWPESDENSAKATLRSSLARLRDGLGRITDRPHLAFDRSTVSFDFTSDFELDLHHLESAYALARTLRNTERPSGASPQKLISTLQQGAGIWRGYFLEGFSLRDAPDFDDWARSQGEAWHHRLEVVLDQLSLLRIEAGENASAIETINLWLVLNPLDERAHRRLMQVYLQIGDRVAAIRAYESCRTLLAKELAVRPEPQTEALRERIKTALPSPLTPRQPSSPRPDLPLLDGPLVGRADEFSQLVQLYHTVSQGGPQAVILLGEAGIGKTRLVADFLEWTMAQGADVLQGRAFEAGARLPYQPLADAIRPRLERETAIEALLSDTWLSELSRLLPELRDDRPHLPTPVGDESAARIRLFEALTRLGRVLARRTPVVLFIDDVQWADAASLDVLRYAGRRWVQDNAAVLLIFCMRSEALTTSPPLEEWLHYLRRDLSLIQLDLGPLTLEDTVQLLRELSTQESPSPTLVDFARWVFAESGGQPFFTIELLRALLDLGALAPRRHENGGWVLDIIFTPGEGAQSNLMPPAVRQLIHSRLAPLTAPARDLLAAAAVLGQRFNFEQLCNVGRLADEDALIALDEAVRSHLLREADGSTSRITEEHYVFTHDKIRDVVYTESGEARRRIFHSRALETLKREGAPASVLARHALAAGLDELALQFSSSAGDETMRLLAARDAAAHYERAIELATRLGSVSLLADLHARRGHAFVSVGMWPEARQELEAALDGLEPDESERRASILSDLSEACWWLLDIPAMHWHATEVLALADHLDRGDLEAQALAWLAAEEGSAGNIDRCIMQNQQAIDLSRALGITPPVIAGHYHTLSLYWIGRLDEAVEFGYEGIAIAQQTNDIAWTVSSLPILGLALAGTGQYGEAMQTFAEARRLGSEYGVDNLLARSIAFSAGFHLDLFDFSGAEQLSREARDLALAVNFSPTAVSSGIDLLLNYARQEDVGRSEGLVEEVAVIVEQTSGFHGWLWKLRLTEARAELALARGNWEESIRWAGDVIEQSRARGRVKYQIAGLTTRARAEVAQVDVKAGIATLHQAVALARSLGDPAQLLRPIAELLAIDGDDELAIEGGAAFDRIVGALPDEEMRRQLQRAERLNVFSRRSASK